MSSQGPPVIVVAAARAAAATKSVRFSSASESKEKGRKRGHEDDNHHEKDPKNKKAGVDRRKVTNVNLDELDDVDDWQASEDEQEQEGCGDSWKQKQKAKKRRRNGDDDEDDDEDETTINAKTSLASEGIPVEPFHMRQEQSDGTGFFDGDTYIFRKRSADQEPDAWLESLNETTRPGEDDDNDNENDNENDSDSDGSDQDGLASTTTTTTANKEQWYAKLLNLVSDTETIMQAVIRYGALLKRHPPNKSKNKHNDKASNTTSSSQDQQHQSEAFQLAQSSLNHLTEAANALLTLGDVDIYQKTRNDLLQLIPQQPQQQHPQQQVDQTTTATVSWEYKGSQDGIIHGPYTSEQMSAWTQAGYFVGNQAVQIRTITKQANPKDKAKASEDLLSDLMDDNDDDDDDDTKGDQQGDGLVRGDWVLSDSVDFGAFL
jgi:CD2 antigen cytoplasmic tail-binding protein 2